jgi:hypothetical protein
MMYGVALLALFESNLYWLFSFILSLFVSAYFIFLSCLKTPGADCIQIQYLEQQWRIYAVKTQFKVCKAARVKFDFGWLMWLVFEGSPRQHVLLFRDQISLDEHRLIRVLLRVL